MILSRLFKKLVVPISLVLFAFACKTETEQDKFGGTWTAVKKTANSYEIVDCGLPSEEIIINNDSLSHRNAMEDISFKVDQIKKDNGGGIVYFNEENETSFYRFSWIDKKLGVAKCEIGSHGTKVIRYFVNEANAGMIKSINGGSADCLTGNDVGDPINDSLSIGDGDKVLYIEGNDCLAVRDKQGKQLLSRCFEAFILRVRPVKGNLLPLTFIAGSRSVDMDFFADGDQWISKTATYYYPVGAREEKNNGPFIVSIKNFEFDDIVSHFEKKGSDDTDTTIQH